MTNTYRLHYFIIGLILELQFHIWKNLVKRLEYLKINAQLKFKLQHVLFSCFLALFSVFSNDSWFNIPQKATLSCWSHSSEASPASVRTSESDLCSVLNSCLCPCCLKPWRPYHSYHWYPQTLFSITVHGDHGCHMTSPSDLTRKDTLQHKHTLWPIYSLFTTTGTRCGFYSTCWSLLQCHRCLELIM